MGNQAVGRSIVRTHVASRLPAILQAGSTVNYDAVLVGINGNPRHINCKVSARDPTKIVWSLQDKTQLQHQFEQNQIKVIFQNTTDFPLCFFTAHLGRFRCRPRHNSPT